MAMDLKQACPHCTAEIGEICTDKCEVNGEKIQGLQNALHGLGLLMSDLSIERRQSCTV